MFDLTTIPAASEIFHTKVTDLVMGTDGIVYLVSRPGARTIENYKDLMEVYRRLSKDGKEKIYLLGDITKTEPPEKEVRDYLAVEMPNYVRALAMVSESIMGKAVGSIFKELSEGPYPMRIFAKREDAIIWLKELIAAANAA